MRPIVLTIATILTFIFAWKPTGSEGPAQPPFPPLADTLVAIYADIKAAAVTERPDEFAKFLDTAETIRFVQANQSRRSGSLASYLRRRLASWPDPDTLDFEDLVYQPPYARIALSGPGSGSAYHQDRVLFTFVLFKMEQEHWRLAAFSSLEKERRDHYGTELSYLETELPPKLRFPRLF